MVLLSGLAADTTECEPKLLGMDGEANGDGSGDGKGDALLRAEDGEEPVESLRADPGGVETRGSETELTKGKPGMPLFDPCGEIVVGWLEPFSTIYDLEDFVLGLKKLLKEATLPSISFPFFLGVFSLFPSGISDSCLADLGEVGGETL